MNLPKYNVVIDNNYGYVSFDVAIVGDHEELLNLRPVIFYRVFKQCDGLYAADSTLKDLCEREANAVFAELINFRYIWQSYSGEWKFNPLQFALDNLGEWPCDEAIGREQKCRLPKIKISVLPRQPYTSDVLAECLVNPNGQLSDYLKNAPDKIEHLRGMFVNKKFNEAVELYENELILKIARIPNE